MSATTTRILVLGVVSIFGPANGYQLRRELLSWEVERWAHLNPGSIYSMLGTLEKQGAIERHDLTLDDGGRPVAVYTVTDAGAAEFTALLIEAIATVPDSGDALPLRVALNFGPALTRAQFLGAVRRRIEVLSMGGEIIAQKVEAMGRSATVPPHVVSELGLEIALVDAQLGWLRQLETDVAAGGLSFADDADHGTGWVPAPDDPGWRMAEERDRYLARIREQRGA
ncbi:MAG TPA: PadR family transcriptional regulator [Pseudolysinimonas sp.]|nr:PadR family transcriptional regulator [Pseudolysinimonas sp.]